MCGSGWTRGRSPRVRAIVSEVACTVGRENIRQNERTQTRKLSGGWPTLADRSVATCVESLLGRFLSTFGQPRGETPNPSTPKHHLPIPSSVAFQFFEPRTPPNARSPWRCRPYANRVRELPEFCSGVARTRSLRPPTHPPPQNETLRRACRTRRAMPFGSSESFRTCRGRGIYPSRSEER